jgi:hydroxymethylbilane synthase
MLPACGQGIVCVETRVRDSAVRALLDKIHDPRTGICAVVERTILQILDGSCHTPIGAYAEWQKDGRLFVRAMVAQPDGSESFQAERIESVLSIAEAQRIATDLASEVRANAPVGVLPACRTGT